MNSAARGSKRVSKRAACDRCREQKSKCPREAQGGKSDSERCARCVKAGTICNFSISLRAGRPSSTKYKPPPKRKESSSSDQASRETTSSDQTAPWGVLTQEPRGYTHDAVNREDDLLFLSPEIWTLNDEAAEASERTNMPKPSEPYFTRDFPGIFGGEHMDFLNHPEALNTNLRGADEGLSPMNLGPFARNYSWGLNDTNYPAIRGFSQSHNTSLGESPISTLLTHPQARMGEASRMASESRTKSGTNGDIMLADTAIPPCLQTTPGDRAEWEGSSRMYSTTPNSPPSRSEDETQESPPAYSSSTNQDIQHRRMHELSELGLIVYSQVGEANSQPEANPLALNVPNNLAAMVLESSVKFLSLLTSLYPPRPPPCSLEDAQTTTSTDEDICTTSNKNNKSSHGPNQQKHPKPHDTNPSSAASNPQPVDMTEVFALLTCYIRILHLHHHLYSRTCAHLTTPHRTPAPLFPGLQAGTVSLDPFATFQIKLLIQISTHVLGEIEMALGLPDGYRISKRKGSRRGIFEGSVSVQFIEMTMKEKGRAGLGGDRDEFVGIREHLGRLRGLLRGTINA